MLMDWAKEGDKEYTVYPEGTYKVCIDGYEEATASTGTKQIRWKSTIMEPAEYAGKPLTIHTAMTDKSLWRIARLVKACGVDLKSLGKVEVGSNSFFHALDGCLRRSTYWHVLKTLDNKGRDRNEVDDFRVDTEQATPPDNEEDIPDFLKQAKE